MRVPRYRRLDGTERDYLTEPLRLVAHRDNWYALAKNRPGGELRAFALIEYDHLLIDAIAGRVVDDGPGPAARRLKMFWRGAGEVTRGAWPIRNCRDLRRNATGWMWARLLIACPLWPAINSITYISARYVSRR
ncbi:MAG TPA: hypothetical protein PLU30_10695 [Verrucomicrobiae bacterium]|nr:hypothetical protein [Verrucomicrobiae bacterium]